MGSIGRRAAVIGAAAFMLVVAAIDSRLPHVALSLFYVLPIFAVAWLSSRFIVGVFTLAATACSLIADMATGVTPVYAYLNAGCRLILFVLVGATVLRLRRAMEAERAAAAEHLRLAEQERELNELRRSLALRVMKDARQPLSEIQAKVVDLGFDGASLSPAEQRELVSGLVEASSRVSRLLEDLDPDVARST